LRRVLGTLMVLIGAFTSVAFLMAIGLGVWLWRAQPDDAVPEGALLRLDLAGALTEAADGDPLTALLSEPSPGLRAVIEGLDRAARDSRISGLIADFSQTRPSLAAAQELRAAVTRFRAAGKFTAVFADSFGERERSTQAYYLATAFERIWMQPSGSLDVTGYRSETPFFADLLALIGVRAEFSQRHEYKGAADSVRLSRMDPAVRRSLTGLLNDLHRQTIDGIAESRKLERDLVVDAVTRAPLFAEEALERRLIDRIGYRDQLVAAARLVLGGGNPTLNFVRYAADTKPAEPSESARLIAVIGVRGAIQRGKAPESGIGGDQVYGDSVAEAIDKATRDRRVAAILLRIDSPGGSYVASDTVWRAVKMARAAGKPVVASLGGVAASGGYFIAMAADRIVTEPATITGSIGVIGGKFVVSGLLDKLGVHVDAIDSAANAGFYSATQAFTPAQRARFDEALDRIYADFTSRVVVDRNLDPAKIDGLARGRIWTGAQAVEVGLVDALGGQEEAVAIARKLAELPDTEAVSVIAYPPLEPGWRRLARRLQRIDETGVAMREITEIFGPSFAWLRAVVSDQARGEVRLDGPLGFNGP